MRFATIEIIFFQGKQNLCIFNKIVKFAAIV